MDKSSRKHSVRATTTWLWFQDQKLWWTTLRKTSITLYLEGGGGDVIIFLAWLTEVCCPRSITFFLLSLGSFPAHLTLLLFGWQLYIYFLFRRSFHFTMAVSCWPWTWKKETEPRTHFVFSLRLPYTIFRQIVSYYPGVSRYEIESH